MTLLKVLFYIVGISLLTFSCTSKLKVKNACEQKLERLIIKYWKYNGEDKIYSINKEGFLAFKEEECFFNLSIDDIERKLGKPNIRQENKMKYFVKKNCLQIPQKSCTCFEVELDQATKKIKQMKLYGYSIK